MFGRKGDIVVLIVLQIALGLPYLNCIPRMYVDEVWDSSLGYNLATTGSLRHPFVEGLGGMEVNYLPPRVILPIVSAVVFKVTDYSTAASRIGSILFSLLAILSLYKIMYHWFGRKQAFFASLAMIINSWFFEVSRRVRPEIYYIALSSTFLWLLIIFFSSGSNLLAFFAGVFAGLSGLSHPNGLLLVFIISGTFIIWQKGRLLGSLLFWAAIGFVIVILPYLIYVISALQNQQVDFLKQMQTKDLIDKFYLTTEIIRWKGFLKWPLGAGFALIMLLSWVAAWYKSESADKVLAVIVLLYVILLPFISVSEACRYLAATIPFFSAIGVRLVWRIMTDRLFPLRQQYKLKLTTGTILVFIYLSTSISAISLVFYRLHNASFDESLNRIASVVGSDGRVCGDPILWLGHEKYRYGPWWLFDEKSSFQEITGWGRTHKFGYAVRTAWVLGDFKGIDEPPMEMPTFREYYILDNICFLFGTKLDEFRDPYYGPIEIYKLNWNEYNWPQFFQAREQAMRKQ